MNSEFKVFMIDLFTNVLDLRINIKTYDYETDQIYNYFVISAWTGMESEPYGQGSDL